MPVTANTTEAGSTWRKRPIPTPIFPVTYRVMGEETNGKCGLSVRGRNSAFHPPQSMLPFSLLHACNASYRHTGT